MITIVGLAVLSLILFLAALVYAALIIASDADDRLDRHGLSDEQLARIQLYTDRSHAQCVERSE